MTRTHCRKAYRSRAVGIALLAGVLAIAGSGCARKGRWTRGDYHLSYNLPFEDRGSISRPLKDSDLEPISAKIYLISDNQRHELLGSGVEWFRNAFSDSNVSPVAIRPPQLDLYGQDLLGEALSMTDGFVLHLGDACDISNTGEFGRFAWDMRNAPRGWVMAPGNHDGYIFGNSSRTKDSLIEEWHAAAESYEFDGAMITSRGMQKDRYVSYYLAALILQDQVWSGPLARALGPGCEKRFASWTQRDPASSATEVPRSFPQYWQELVELEEEIYRVAELIGDQEYRRFDLPGELAPDRPHLRRLAWRIDKKKVWRSFILQEVDIGAPAAPTSSDRERISILVLDTSQYGFQPQLESGILSSIASALTLGFFDIQVAGKHGNILDPQEEAAKEFARSMKEEGRSWILASHHPYKALGRATRPRFDWIRDAGGIPVTLSAHTHFGEMRWNHDGDREGDWLEINVGSLLDSPAEFRDLQFHRLGDRVAISSRRRPLEDVLRERGLLIDELPGYRPSPGDPDYYLDYKQGSFDSAAETDFTVKRILLAAYLRMLRLFEADHPDQSSTRWPSGPDGKQLRSHEEVTEGVRRMLAGLQIAEVEALTRFLYELREFDRTRKFSDATGERLRAYRLSQAIWAGRIELTTKGRRAAEIDPDISFLILPRPAAETPAQIARHADAR